jgi:hypothetical protein
VMTDRDETDDDTQPGGLPSDLTDDETPVGDTPEVHDKLIPRDLPPGHPSRGEVERQYNEDRS